MTDLPEGTVRLNINIDRSLHQQFKVACAITGERMTDVLLNCVRSYVKEHPSAPSPKKAAKK